jgi:hypothetical protein
MLSVSVSESVSVYISPKQLLGNGSVNTFHDNEYTSCKITVLYAVRVVSQERLWVLSLSP